MGVVEAEKALPHLESNIISGTYVRALVFGKVADGTTRTSITVETLTIWRDVMILDAPAFTHAGSRSQLVEALEKTFPQLDSRIPKVLMTKPITSVSQIINDNDLMKLSLSGTASGAEHTGVRSSRASWLHGLGTCCSQSR